MTGAVMAGALVVLVVVVLDHMDGRSLRLLVV
jgi:hypothetical protein